MRRKRFLEKQITIPREHGARADGRSFPQARMTSASVYTWKAKLGGTDVSDEQKLPHTSMSGARVARELDCIIIAWAGGT